MTSPATTTAADTCTYPGQSMGFYLRVLHDSNSTPVVGASVTGAYRFPYTCTPDSTEQLSTSRPILGFATNETEWHPLYGINDGTYALTVVYSDREYNLTAQSGPSTYTCATLYVPSGRTSTNSSPAPCSLEGPVTLTASYGDWRFEAQANPVSVAEGQEINYTCYLVNVSGQAQSADLANPLCNPEIDAQGGQTAWAYEPSAETNAIQIVPAGEVLSFSLGIPTSELQAGEAYVLSSFPNIGTVGSPDIGFGQNMQLNQAITMEASANTVSSSVDSSTPPCSAPDVYCGTFQIMSGNLTANGDGSLLDLTLLETGNVYMSSATVYINGTVIGIPPAFAYEPPGNIGINLAPKQQTVLGLAVPNSTISIQAGSTYTVMVDAWVGSPGKASTSSQETINIAAAASGPATSTSASAISTTRPTSTFSSASSIAPSTLLGTGAVVAVAAAVLEIGRRRAGKAVSERTVGHGNATIPAEVLLV